MEEEQRFQIFELADSKVSTSSSLLTFFTKNTNTNVSLKNHTDIIGSVTNSESSFLWESFLD